MKAVIFITLVFCLMVGCYTSDAMKSGVQKWKYIKNVDGYNVTVYIQRDEHGRCLMRDVTMQYEVGLRMDILGDRPQYVRAIDLDCDEVFDVYFWRDPLDEQRSRKDLLSQRLNFYFYMTAPIWQHGIFLQQR